jgi:hypothetical protein
MFVADETLTLLSHVTFYRCSLCVGEHVSSQPVQETGNRQPDNYFATSDIHREHPLAV